MHEKLISELAEESSSFRRHGASAQLLKAMNASLSH